MAFCAVTHDNLRNLTLLTYSIIREDPSSLKNLKDFTQGLVNNLVGRNVPIEKALTLVSYLPQIISEFNSEKADRKLLKDAGVSMDAIQDAEDVFEDYKKLANYVGIKNEASPLVLVNENQLAQEAKLTKHIEDTKVTFEGDVRIINGKRFDTRATSIAKVGFDDKTDEEVEDQPLSHALKHGNTVDAIAKGVFDETNPKFEDYSELIEPAAFDSLIANLKAVKSALQQEGFVFKSGVTLYSNQGISGEADLIAINPEGKGYILDFKTSSQRFNETYLKNEKLVYSADNVSHEVGILSKWKQYGTQGYIYGQMMKEQLGIEPVAKTGIIGINISYDKLSPYNESKITKVVGIEVHNIPYSDVRPEFKGKNVAEMLQEFQKLQGAELGPVTEIKERRIFKSGRKPKSLDRIAAIDEIAATDTQLQQEVDWIKSSPLGKGLLLNLSNMVNTGLFGNFKLDGITIYKNASQGTVYHEGWHRFSQVFMTPDEKMKLYNSVKEDAIPFSTRDGRKVNTSEAEFIDVEEFLAEQFAKYALNPTEYSYPKPKSSNPVIRFFQEIWEFLQRYFSSNPRPIDLFQKLYTGKIAEYVPSVNNAFWGNLNSLAQTIDGQEIVSNERFPLYVRSIDYLVGKALRDAGKSFTAFKQSKRLQSQVLENVFLSLEAIQNDPSITFQQSEELFEILANRRDFVRSYLTATSYDTLKDFTIDEEVFSMTTEELSAMEDIREEYTDDEDVDATESEDSRPERFDRAGNEDSAFSLADDAIQDFFRTIPKIKDINSDGTYVYELNELGLPENHKFYDVFYKTKKILSGSFKMEEMQQKMQDPANQNIFPELTIVNDFISKFMNPQQQEKNFYRSVQNTQFVQAFYHVMSMPEVPNMQLTLNYTRFGKHYLTFKSTMATYRTASRALSLKIIKTWEKNFKDRRNKTFADFKNWENDRKNMVSSSLYLTEDGKLLLNPFVDYATKYPSTLNGVRLFWENMGVTLNPKVFKDKTSVENLTNTKNLLTSNIAIYRNYIHPNFISVASSILADSGIELPKKDISSIFNAMPNIMMDVLAKEFFIGNPISSFNEKKVYEIETKVDGKNVNVQQSTIGMRFIYEDLAAIEEKFGERVSSGSFRIEDKTKYPYYNPNQLLLLNEMINKVDRTTQFADNLYLQNLDPIKNPWMKRSFFMKTMFNNRGERTLGMDKTPVRIIVEDIASVRNITDEGISEKSPRSLNKDEKFFVDVITLFKAGAIEIPRAETSSTMFSIRLSDYGKGKQLPIALDESLPKTSGDSLPRKFHAIVKDYFMGEIEKRQWFMRNDPEVVGANKIALSKQFNVFEGILPQTLKDRVVENLDKTPEEIFALPELEAEFRIAVNDYFEQQISNIRPKFDNAKLGFNEEQKRIIRDSLEAKDANMLSVARLFVLNHFILSQEFYQLYFGDLYFYKNAFKRGKIVTNTGNTFYIDDTRNGMLNSIQNSTMHSIITGTKPGGKDFRYVNTSIMNDVEMKSAYVNEDDSKNLLLQGILSARVASGILAPNTPEYTRFVADTKDSLAKYDLINVADGQGIIGMDFYRNFSIVTNIWDEKKEREYERQKAIFRNHFNLYFKLDSNGNRVRMEGDELEEARAADRRLREQKPFAFFNPLKISYTGPQAKNGPTRPVFDKFSVRPMIPEAAIGKRDEGLMLNMAKDDIDYVKFRSGTKVYQDSSFDWYNKVADGVYDLNDFTTEEIVPNQLLSAFLKHQLSTEGFKEENIFGSQFRKIVFGVKYSPLTRNNPAEFKKFSDLEKRFKDTVDELLEIEQEGLFALLGITEKNGTYKVADMKKFLQLLQTESIKRGVAINNIDYIQYDEATKNAKYPIDYAFNRQQIQDLLSGLIDERLRRLKVNGSSLIQVSSAGSESKSQKFTNPTREDIERYGTNGLHYYHMIYDEEGKPIRTSTMGVKVALIGEYENLLKLDAPASLGVSDVIVRVHDQMVELATDASGNPVYSAGTIDTLERLNQALKDPEWRALHADKLRLVGYRIPTQNINFIDNMEIMEFLPKSAGSVIIPPIEAIIKSGSDFDIDKTNVLRPSIDRDGGLVSSPTTRTVKDGKTSYTPDTLAFISQKIAEQTYDERDLKKRKKQLKDMQAGINMDLTALIPVQHAIRITMLDLLMKAGIKETLFDSILLNVEQGAPDILPSAEQLAEEDELEILDAATELGRVIIQFYQVDQEIERLNEKYKDLGKEKGKIEGVDLKWITKKRDYKYAKNNDLLFILTDLMSHPYYFEPLITPSSASMFEGFTNELMASQQKMTSEQYQQALEETDNKLFDRSLTPQQASEYGSTLESFDNLLSKRKDLGGYAIQRTFADIFNFAGLSIAKEYEVEVKANKYEIKVIHTPLIAPSDRSKSLQNGRILMHGDSVNGIPIAKSFDELISLTVDLAGAPAYPYTGINNYNKKQVQYLLHQKTDPKHVIWFMNQPILKDLFFLYEEKRRRVQGYTLKHAIGEMSLNAKILKNPNLYETGTKKKYEILSFNIIPAEKDFDGTILEPSIRVPNPKKANQYLSKPWYDLHTQNLEETDYFSIEDMDNSIRGKYLDDIQKVVDNYFGVTGRTRDEMSKRRYELEKGDPEIIRIQQAEGEIKKIEDIEKKKQGKILAYFASITEEADWLMKLQFAENVDTTKYSTLTSLIRNESNRRDIRDKTNIFDHSQLDLIEKESMIAPFDYTQKAKSILKALFPKLYTNRTIGAFTELVTDVWGAKNIQIERISKIVENDYIEYIYKNYGTYNGYNISDDFQNQLVNLDGTVDHEFFTYKLNSLKATYPELLDIPFVSGLYEDVYFPPDKEIVESYANLDNKEIHNAFFLRNPDNPTFEKNIFTNNWRNLINFDPERLGLKDQYTTEDIKKISDFFHELVYFSLYQSGLTNTGNGFSDLIPYEYWTSFIEQAFSAYDRAKTAQPDLEFEMLEEFKYRFRQMNPKINWRTRTRVLDTIDPETGRNDTIPIDFFKNYYRGKDYKVTDDDLMLARTLFLRTDEELEDINTSVQGPTKAKGMSKYKVGSYVEYLGVKHILINQFAGTIWQLYDPEKLTKVAVRETGFTPLSEQGAVVQYGKKQYLVTSKQEIIDIEKNKKMDWVSTNRNRINVLALAAEQQKPPTPPTGMGPEGQPPIEPIC